MTDKLVLEKFNNSYLKITCPVYLAQELKDYFTFRVPGWQFTPAGKFKKWDGYISLYNMFTGLIYLGLKNKVEHFAKERGYDIEYAGDFSNLEFSVVEAVKFIKTLNLPEEYKIRDYQAQTIISAIRNKRMLVVSAVNSGKSLIIYILTRFFNVKTLILVPKTSLVEQMSSDFVSYGCDKNLIHKIYAGEEKDSDRPIYISTWQSVYKERKDYFLQFELVICDEAHNAKAKSLTDIMEKCENAQYRYGFTGSLNSENIHKLVLEGLFGKIKIATTSAELIEKGFSSPIKIKAIVLQYPDNIKKEINTRKVEDVDGKKKTKPFTYQEEIDFLLAYEPRNNFIKNLALSLKGNTFLAFRRIEEQGKTLYEMIKGDSQGNVYYIDGQTSVQERENIRGVIEKEVDAILCASLGVFQEGTNIKRIHNMIFTFPSKSTIVVVQSIGRGLRKSKDKVNFTLFDIADDLSWKKRKNYTLEHFGERIKIYNEQKFPYKIYNVKLKG